MRSCAIFIKTLSGRSYARGPRIGSGAAFDTMPPAMRELLRSNRIGRRTSGKEQPDDCAHWLTTPLKQKTLEWATRGCQRGVCRCFDLKVAVFVMACLVALGGCSKKTVQKTSNNASGAAGHDNPQLVHQKCVEAAKKALGEDVEIVKQGTFNTPSIQEAVAVVRAQHVPSTNAQGLAISKLAILRRGSSGWEVVLTASKEIQNGAGFVGIDYIDDSSPYYGYRVLFPDQRDDGKRVFTLGLSYMRKDGSTEGIPLEISWDSSVGRYREFGINSDPPGFKPEVKNPPHLKR